MGGFPHRSPAGGAPPRTTQWAWPPTKKRRHFMNLYLQGTDNKYAAEQTLLTLFPEERPEYPEGEPAGERCELTVTRGEKYACLLSTSRCV